MDRLQPWVRSLPEWDLTPLLGRGPGSNIAFCKTYANDEKYSNITYLLQFDKRKQL